MASQDQPMFSLEEEDCNELFITQESKGNLVAEVVENDEELQFSNSFQFDYQQRILVRQVFPLLMGMDLITMTFLRMIRTLRNLWKL